MKAKNFIIPIIAIAGIYLVYRIVKKKKNISENNVESGQFQSQEKPLVESVAISNIPQAMNACGGIM